MPVSGTKATSFSKLGLDRFYVGIDVGVVEFDRSDDRGLRVVVDELWNLVEKRGVVLIAFDDEVFALSEPKALPEVLRHPADQQTRIALAAVQQPRKKAGGRSLAVSAGDHHAVAVF